MRIRVLIRISIFALAALVAGCGGTPAAVPAPTPAAPTAGKPLPTSTAAAAPSVAAAPTATTAPAAPSPTPAATATQPRPKATPPAPPATPGAPASTLPAGATPTASIVTASGKRVTVKLEVAATPESRAIGLSKRASLPEDAGMIFVFPSDDQAPFWMKDTWIPLSIAFISSNGQIVDIQDMQALTEDLHRPSQPYRYALEVNQGFFSKNGVSAGDRVELQLGGR